MRRRPWWQPAEAARSAAAACLAGVTCPDVRFGLLAAAMWGTWAWKLAPHVTPLDNAQSAAGLVAIVAVSLLWPAAHPASFRRSRTPALAGLRLFLLCLPFNFSQRVLDLALPHHLERGRLAPLVNLSHLISASHLDFLLFTSLGWRLPLRPHMALQALKLAILGRFGVHAHCRGALLSSPEVQQLAAKTHSMLSLAAGVVAPGAVTVLLEPRTEYVSVVALLLLAWVLLGWVVPTVLLLPPPAAAPAAAGPAAPAAAAFSGTAQAAEQPGSSGDGGGRQQPGGCEQPGGGTAVEASPTPVHSLLATLVAAADGAAALLEGRLRSLSWHQQQQQQRQQQQQQRELDSELRLPVPLAWLGTVSCAWICCCSVAPLYANAP